VCPASGAFLIVVCTISTRRTDATAVFPCRSIEQQTSIGRRSVRHWRRFLPAWSLCAKDGGSPTSESDGPGRAGRARAHSLPAHAHRLRDSVSIS